MTGMKAIEDRDKWAEAPIHPLLRVRWSPRAFSTRSMERGTLQAIFEAARWAPSSFNAQPWSFIVAVKEDTEAFGRMLSVLAPQNAQWARNAAVLILAVVENNLAATGRPNRYAFYDVGQAVAQLTMEATARGISAHQMGGFDPEKAHEIFGLPPDYEPAAIIALGYAGEADSLPVNLQKLERAPRQRKALEEFVFTGRWGEAARLDPSPAARGLESYSRSSIHGEARKEKPAGFAQGGQNDQTDQV